MAPLSQRARQHARLTPVLLALADETRLHLVSRMCHEGPLSIARLTAGTDLSRQAVTKHLRVLSDAGLAQCDRRGREQHWQIEARRLADVRRSLEQISDQWDRALARLRDVVEAPPRR